MITRTIFLKHDTDIREVLSNPAVLAWCASNNPETIDAVETVFQLLNLSLKDRIKKEVIHIDDASDTMTIILVDKDKFYCDLVLSSKERNEQLDADLYDQELLLDEP
jgi:hypothetical protein